MSDKTRLELNKEWYERKYPMSQLYGNAPLYNPLLLKMYEQNEQTNKLLYEIRDLIQCEFNQEVME